MSDDIVKNESANLSDDAKATKAESAIDQIRLTAEQFPAIKTINDNFAKLNKNSFTQYFAKPFGMFVESIKVQTYEEVLRQTFNPSLFCALSMKPLRGEGILGFPPALVFSWIDLTFGGTGELRVKAEGRAFTAFELKAMKELILLILKDLKTAWEPVYPIHPGFLRIETNSQLVYSRILPVEQVVEVTYAMDFGHYHDFFNLCLPVSMLDPIQERLRQNAEVLPSSSDVSGFEPVLVDDGEPMEILKSWDPKTIADHIRNEHPQTVAYILVLLDDSEKAGAAIANLPYNLRADVSYRIAIMRDVRKNARQFVYQTVAEITRRGDKGDFELMGGTEVCYDILQNVGEEMFDDILSLIRQSNPDLADQLLVEGKIYTMVSNEILKSRQSEQEIDLQAAKDLMRSRQRIQAMQTVFDDVIKLLSAGGKELVNGLENIEQSMEESFSQLPEDQLESLYRETIVDAMVLAVDYWLQTSGKDKIELAEESRIWTVYLDKGTHQTRTLDKYLGVSKLPQNPRWKDVVQTVQFVLEAGPESHSLKPKLQSSLSQLHALMRVKRKYSDS